MPFVIPVCTIALRRHLEIRDDLLKFSHFSLSLCFYLVYVCLMLNWPALELLQNVNNFPCLNIYSKIIFSCRGSYEKASWDLPIPFQCQIFGKRKKPEFLSRTLQLLQRNFFIFFSMCSAVFKTPLIYCKHIAPIPLFTY